MSFRDVSLKRKLLVIMTLTSTCTLVLAGLILIAIEVPAFRSRHAKEQGILTEILAEHVAAALYFEDRPWAEQILGALRADPEALAVRLYTLDGKIFAESPSDPGEASFPHPRGRDHVFRGGQLFTFRRVYLDGELIGTVGVETSMRYMYERLQRYTIVVGSVLLVSVLASLGLAIAAHRLISRPILNLAQAARRVSEDGDYSLRVKKESDDEVGSLVDDFNAMLQQIQQRDEELTSAWTRLERAHDQKEQLIAAITSFLIGIDGDDAITLWNGPAEETFGLDASDALGKRIWELELTWDLCPFESLVREVRSSGGGLCSELTLQRTDGKSGTLRVSISPLGESDPSSSSMLIIGEDLTEQKALELQLHQAQKLESIGQLAAGIAHEINTPTQYVGDNTRFLRDSFEDLAPILEKLRGLVQSVLEGSASSEIADDLKAAMEDIDVEDLSHEIPRAIGQSLEGLERVRSIVVAMKRFSHPGAEDMTAVDLSSALESTIIVATNEWKYVAEVQTEFDSELPPVPCLPGEINQVFLNLIVNAAHAIGEVVTDDSDDKGLITVSARKQGDWAEIRIADTGPGIPHEVRERIFDPFFTTKDVGKGTGQGLSIARTVVVEKHRGTLTFESEIGRGTTFVVRLPLAREAGSATQAPPEGAEAGAA